jgi:hypothetical protein
MLKNNCRPEQTNNQKKKKELRCELEDTEGNGRREMDGGKWTEGKVWLIRNRATHGPYLHVCGTKHVFVIQWPGLWQRICSRFLCSHMRYSLYGLKNDG